MPPEVLRHDPGAATSTRIVPDVVREHAERAAFFWAQRDTVAQDDPPDWSVIAGIDRRLEANLDGLRISGSAAWPFIVAQYEDFPEKGELFVATVMAVEQKDSRRIEQVLQFGRMSEDARGLVGALAWLKPDQIGPLVRNWIASADAFERFLGVSACVEHTVDPSSRLSRLAVDRDARVRALSYQLVGKLKRHDMSGTVRAGLADADEPARFWAAWALVELGAGDLAKSALKRVAVGGGPQALAALRSVVKTGPEKDVRTWLGSLLKSPDTAAVAVRGAGMLGDRSVLHWLIHQMRNPPLSLPAGAAFLELFPEASEADGLFTLEPSQLGQAFAQHFGDGSARLPLADKVKDWAREKRLLTP
jgi:uncharacterized protein (TIGR02270 family)